MLLHCHPCHNKEHKKYVVGISVSIRGVLSSLQSADLLDTSESTFCRGTVPAPPCGNYAHLFVSPRKKC